MNPAYSVIFFTTASGAGYGLLALLGILNIGNYLPHDKWFFLIALILSLSLITAGLLSSTFHLGHPERAWRALTQWQTSWLSREGVAAIFTYMPACVMVLGWIIEETNRWRLYGHGYIGRNWIFCNGLLYQHDLRIIKSYTSLDAFIGSSALSIS